MHYGLFVERVMWPMPWPMGLLLSVQVRQSDWISVKEGRGVHLAD